MKTLSLAVLVVCAATSDRAWPVQPDPLVGGWEVVYGQYGLPDAPVEMTCTERPVQLKVFASGRFAYVRHGEDGSFLAASAGTYSIVGDRYTETTEWSSVSEAIGTRATFRWLVVGDSLCMSGPLQVWDARGQKVEGVAQMKELMRRAGTARADRAICK